MELRKFTAYVIRKQSVTVEAIDEEDAVEAIEYGFNTVTVDDEIIEVEDVCDIKANDEYLADREIGDCYETS